MSSLGLGKDKKEEKIVFLGDSLTEGYGVSREAAFPSLIQNKLNKNKLAYRVINSGISGSTTASGLKRLKWIMKGKPKIVVIALGSNDALRAFPVEEVEKNLIAMMEAAKEMKLKVLLTGQKVPPNYGEEYVKKFDAVFARVAKKYEVAYMPFLLKDVAGEPKLNQSDGIHPNEEGHKVMANNLYKYLEKLL